MPATPDHHEAHDYAERLRERPQPLRVLECGAGFPAEYTHAGVPGEECTKKAASCETAFEWNRLAAWFTD